MTAACRALGATVLALLFAVATSIGCHADECAEGATRCGAYGIERCERDCGDFGCGALQWFTSGFCDAPQRCLAPEGLPARCVESTTPDPRCSAIGESAYCAARAIASCADGYRTKTTDCDAGSMCVVASVGPACVSSDARGDPRCAVGDGAVCDGALLIECVAGLAASITACASCDAAGAASCTACSARRGACTGYLGAGCKVDGDCAAGLVCHLLGSWGGACSVACSPGTDDCARAFASGGPPRSAWTPVFVPGSKLSCIAGYCAWE